MTGWLWGLVPAACVTGWGLTDVIRRYAYGARMVDVPDHRTMHVGEVPRGGGLAIVLTVLAGLVALLVYGWIDPGTFMGLGGGTIAVAAVSWLDDRRHVHSGVRAAVHLLAAAWVTAWLGGLPWLELGVAKVSLGPAGFGLAVLGIAWMINLYNFMDGIDGLAAGEAVSVGALGGILLALTGQLGLAMLAFTVAAASAGFLWWNWAPARIFMGDVGSASLGFLFGSLALASENAGGPPLLAWGILLGVFWFDASITLYRRLARGERWFSPHRQHAYQRAVQSGLGHGTVSGAALVVNVVLGGFAALWIIRPAWLPIGFALATLGLALLYHIVERRHGMAEFPDS